MNSDMTSDMGTRLTIDFAVDGRPRTERIAPNTVLLDLLRDRYGMTGVKASCERGVCGACTTLIDGTLRLLQRLRVQRRRPCGGDRRGTGHGRGTEPGAARLRGVRGLPVRLLHPRHDHADHRPAEGGSGAGRRDDPLLDLLQCVPLHRLSDDHRLGTQGGRAVP